MSFRDVTDIYGNPEGEQALYPTVEVFLEMCGECFGEAPTLYERDGNWYEWMPACPPSSWWESAEDARRLGQGHEVLVLKFEPAERCDRT